MKLFIALVLLASTQAFIRKNMVKDEYPYQPCTDQDGQKIQVSNLDFENVHKNETLHVTVTGVALTDLKTSEVMVDLEKVDDKQLPIPKQHFKWQNDVKAGGDIVFDFKQYIPGITPAGEYNFYMNFLDVKKEKIDCINFQLTF